MVLCWIFRDLILFREIVASRMTPVNPIPPQVALQSSGVPSFVQVSTSPFASIRRKDWTHSLKHPSIWWFLPCTSPAMAPPTLMSLVPGVTLRNQPLGTKCSTISLSNTPDSTLSTPVLSSKSRKQSCALVQRMTSLRALSP